MARRKWNLKKVKSEIIRNEIKKRDYSHYEDWIFVEDLLNLEHWIMDGYDNNAHNGLHIPWFSEDHYTQVIARRKREHRKIFVELKGKEEYDRWNKQNYKAEWYTKRRYYRDNTELLKKANISRIGPRSLLIYKCNRCGRVWQFRALPMNGKYARQSQPNRWWKCLNGCNKDVSLRGKSSESIESKIR